MQLAVQRRQIDQAELVVAGCSVIAVCVESVVWMPMPRAAMKSFAAKRLRQARRRSGGRASPWRPCRYRGTFRGLGHGDGSTLAMVQVSGLWRSRHRHTAVRATSRTRDRPPSIRRERMETPYHAGGARVGPAGALIDAQLVGVLRLETARQRVGSRRGSMEGPVDDVHLLLPSTKLTAYP